MITRSLRFHEQPRELGESAWSVPARIFESDSERGLEASRVPNGLRRLIHAGSRDCDLKLPEDLDRLLEGAEQLFVRMPRNVAQVLEREAPSLWEILTKRAEIERIEGFFSFQRDRATKPRIKIFDSEKEDGSAPGASNLLEFVQHVRELDIPFLVGERKQKETLEVPQAVRAYLRSRWVTRKLSSRLRWRRQADGSHAFQYESRYGPIIIQELGIGASRFPDKLTIQAPMLAKRAHAVPSGPVPFPALAQAIRWLLGDIKGQVENRLRVHRDGRLV